MNAWWALPKAAPILLRHLLAYAELAAADLGRFRRRSAKRLLAVALALIGAWFTLAMICIAVVAAWWDTPHRMGAILCLAVVFAGLTIAAVWVAWPRRAEDAVIFSQVSTEWSKDRLILDRVLKSDDAAGPAQACGVNEKSAAPAGDGKVT